MATSIQPAKLGEVGWQPFPGVTLRQILRGNSAELYRLTWSPDGKLIALICVPKSLALLNSISIWDSISGQLTRNWRQGVSAVADIAWSPDGRKLASVLSNQKVSILDVETGQILQTLTGHTGDIWSVAWSPDGRLLASGSIDGTILIWNAADGKSMRLLEGHFGGVGNMAS